MVDKFREYASSRVKDLKVANDDQNKGDLDQSTRRRIQFMTKATSRPEERNEDRSFESVVPSIESFNPLDDNVEELRQWQSELATWELVHTLFKLYYPEPGSDPEAEKKSKLDAIGTMHPYTSNNDIWDHFLLHDDQAKEKVIILRWLEKTAKENESDIGSITAQLEASSGKTTNTWTSGWLDTKSHIKQAKRMRPNEQLLPTDTVLKPAGSTGELITRLDPDAPSRQSRHIMKSDEYYERALWMVCYEMLRRGMPWHEINEWCKERNEAWRGVSIGVAYESHPNGSPNLSGPTVGYLFRRVCLYACRGIASPYEAAVYGILSGDAKSIEPICRNWDDHLYARYNALLLSRFDEYLSKNHPDRVPESMSQKFVFRDAVANFKDWKTSSTEVVDILKQQKATATQSNSPIKLIQGAIISRTIGDLVHHVGVAISSIFVNDTRPTKLVMDTQGKDSGSPDEGRSATTLKHYSTLANDPAALRILTHIFIMLRIGLGQLHLEEHTEREALDNVLVTYIELLRNTRRLFSIPVYAAQLDRERQVHCLCRVIPALHNFDEQKQMVDLLKVYDLNPVDIISQNFNDTNLRVNGPTPTRRNAKVQAVELLQLSDNTLWPGKRVKSNLAGMDITPGDEEVIEAMKWYMHLENDIVSSFRDLTTGLQSFLANGRIGAAIRVFEELSFDTISQFKTEAFCGYAFDFTAPGTEIQDRNSLSYSNSSIIILSQDEHEEIVATLRNASRSYWTLQQVVRAIALFRDWHAEEEKLINLNDPNAIKTNIKEAKETFAQIQAVMDGIFYSDILNRDLIDNTTNLIEPIMRAYLPELIIGYISILQAAAFFTNRELIIKAMEIANVVAAKKNFWIQRIFLETGRMSELMETFALVSQAMLRLGEHDDKKKAVKKRGNKGETLRIWDVNVWN